jgi:hypothetical protein
MIAVFALPSILVALVGQASAAPAEPCGYVEFRPTNASTVVDGTWYENIQATVHFADGHSETAKIPYRWVYPDGERTDPWSATNLGSPGFVTRFQFPPPEFDRSTLPPLIAYIVRHSNSDGYSDLPNCPTTTRSAAASARIRYQWNTQILTDARAAPGAHLFVAAFLRTSGDEEDLRKFQIDECVLFANHDERVVKRIVFVFQHRVDGGTELPRVTLEAVGSFAKHMVVAPGRDPQAYPYCRALMGQSIPPNPLAITSVYARVSEVDYEDGTSWHATPASLPNTKQR